MKTKKKKFIRIRAKDAKSICKNLATLVVSFDRLGSAHYDDLHGLAMETAKFLRDVHAFKMLSRMRRVLCDAYESGMTEAELQRWYGWLEKAETWKPKTKGRT